MSKCCCRKNVPITPPVMAPQGIGGGCICSLPCLIILILVVLQFSKRHKGYGCDGDDDNCGGGYGFGNQQIGNGVLFIIALFFLSCVGCSRGC